MVKRSRDFSTLIKQFKILKILKLIESFYLISFMSGRRDQLAHKGGTSQRWDPTHTLKFRKRQIKANKLVKSKKGLCYALIKVVSFLMIPIIRYLTA